MSKNMNDGIRKELFYKVYMGDKLVNDHATFEETAKYVWSDENTDENPCRIIDEFGDEVGW